MVFPKTKANSSIRVEQSKHIKRFFSFQSFLGRFLVTEEYTQIYIICLVVAIQGRLKYVYDKKKIIIL